MKGLIAGGTGFVGRALAKYLKGCGYHLALLSRTHLEKADHFDLCIHWDELEKHKPEEFDIIVNLCGYNIASRRWSQGIKEKIIDSRDLPTQRLTAFIDGSNTRLLNASAIGYYRFSEQQQSETQYLPSADNEKNFSQTIVSQWEAAAHENKNIQATAMRFGVVIGPNGGMLEKLRLPAQLGLGAVLGSGNQMFTWIHIDDLCRAIQAIIEKPIDLAAINIVSPQAVSQRYFADCLSAQLHRPRFLRLPESVIRMLFGQMGEELMLGSHNIYPQILLDNDFSFQYPSIEQALAAT